MPLAGASLQLMSILKFIKLRYEQEASKAGLAPNEPINIEPNVNIGVNNTNGSITYRKYP